MILRTSQIPDEGKDLSGELDPAFLQADTKNESFKKPVRYELMAQMTDDGPLITGSFAVDTITRCARCWEEFEFEHRIDNYAFFDPDLKNVEELDLTESIREEILINLPSYPHCDELTDRECPGIEFLEENQRKVAEEFEKQKKKEADEHKEDTWSALDGLKVDPDEES
jgi:uncharacterized metal-binding protein YceD (DUF177 family)